MGTGFGDSALKEISVLLEKAGRLEKPIEKKLPDDRLTTWIQPVLVVEVTYASLTSDGLYREAVFERIRHDLSEV